MSRSLTRRELLTASGLTFAVCVTPSLRMWSAQAADAARFEPQFWLSIGSDDSITIVSPAAEMGQGSYTSIPLLVCEDLDADFNHVQMVRPAFNTDKRFVNPAQNNWYQNVASSTLPGYFLPARLAGAQARLVLLQAAATHWAVPVSELRTELGVVIHDASGRRLSYGAIAAFAQVPAVMPVVTEKNLKPLAHCRYLGKDVARRDLPDKTNGKAQFAIDVRVPNMVYATLLGVPHDGAVPMSMDDTQTQKVAGLIDIVTLKEGVAIVASTMEGALAGKRALRVIWSSDAPAAHYDSEQVLSDFARVAADKSQRGAVFNNDADVDSKLAAAAKVYRADYATRHVYHAQMEPLNALASVAPDGKSAELWVGTQSPTLVMNGCAAALQTTPDKIKLNLCYLGGGFGRRSGPDISIEAVLLSKRLGRPVKLVMSREDDLKHGQFRPITAQHFEAAVDAQGKLTVWEHRLAAESVMAYKQGEAQMTRLGNHDTVVMKGVTLDHYGIASRRIEFLRQRRGMRVSYLRGVGAGHNLFASEGFIDEIAHDLRRDPLEFRLAMTRNVNPRVTALLETVARMSNWHGKRAAGRALGIAVGEKDATLFAGVAEVSVNQQTGVINVHKLWAAMDCGMALQPANLRAQTEGGMVFGLGHALREEITIRDGRVVQSSFPDYQVARMADIPEMEVAILSTDNPPTGGGEAGVPIPPACIGNAVFALTGARLRELPMTPARVLAALRAPRKTNAAKA